MEDVIVKYRIIETHPKEHSVTVRYYTDKLTEDMLATERDIDGKPSKLGPDGKPLRCRTDYYINVWEPEGLTEERLHELLTRSVNFDWFKLQHKILDPNIDTSLSIAENLKGKEFFVNVPKLPNQPSQLSDEEIDKLIKEFKET